jgi:hypothetical protein
MQQLRAYRSDAAGRRSGVLADWCSVQAQQLMHIPGPGDVDAAQI